MTRIVGTLYGPDGPLNGRLFIKPSTPFIGFTKGVSFKIVDGQVDIELPPNTSTTVFQAGWRDQFDPGVVEYSERWHVPRGIEVSLDVVRGLKRRESTQAGRSTAGVDQAMWKMEAEKAQKRAEELDNDLKKALLTIKALEGKSASAAGASWHQFSRNVPYFSASLQRLRSQRCVQRLLKRKCCQTRPKRH